jgi:hypothetical protein
MLSVLSSDDVILGEAAGHMSICYVRLFMYIYVLLVIYSAVKNTAVFTFPQASPRHLAPSSHVSNWY